MKKYFVKILGLIWMLSSFQVYAVEQDKASKIIDIFLSGELFDESREDAEEVFEFLILRPFFGHDYEVEKLPDATYYGLEGRAAFVVLEYAKETNRLSALRYSPWHDDLVQMQVSVRNLLDKHHFKFYLDKTWSGSERFEKHYLGNNERFNVSIELNDYVGMGQIMFAMNYKPQVETLASMIQFHQNKDLFSKTLSELKAYLFSQGKPFRRLSVQKDSVGRKWEYLSIEQYKDNENISAKYYFDPETKLLSKVQIQLPVIQRQLMRQLLKKVYGYEGAIYNKLILNNHANIQLHYYGSDYNRLLDKPFIEIFREPVYRSPVQYLCKTKSMGEKNSLQEYAYVGFNNQGMLREQEYMIRFSERNLQEISPFSMHEDAVNPKVLYIEQNKFKRNRTTLVRKLTFEEPVRNLLQNPVGFHFEVYYADFPEGDEPQTFKKTDHPILKEGECQPETGY